MSSAAAGWPDADDTYITFAHSRSCRHHLGILQADILSSALAVVRKLPTAIATSLVRFFLHLLRIWQLMFCAMEAVTFSEVSYREAPLLKLRIAQECARRDSLSSSRTGDSGYISDLEISLSPLDIVSPTQSEFSRPRRGTVH